MKVIWQGYDLPSFEFDTEERAIVIGALRLAAEKDTSEKLARLLKTLDQIDRVLTERYT